MESNERFESEVLSLLSQLNAQKEKLQSQHAAEMAELDKKIEAVSTTARLIRDSGEGSLVTIAPRKSMVIPGNLRGKSTREACVQIAEQNNGTLKVGDVKEALVLAGIVRSRKHAWGAIYTALTRSKEFEKGPTPGTFRLVSKTGSVNLQQMLSPVRAM
jgi:hypothetical protein